MSTNFQRIMQMMSIVPVLIGGRFLSSVGQSGQAMRLMGRHINSARWKVRSFVGYEPTAQDVFVATFAKSGTNWMMQIAQQIVCLGAAEFDHIHDLVPWPDAPFPEICARLNDRTIAQCSPSGLRIVKTHYDRGYVPFQEQAKYITVIRDPKEVLVSSYYFGKAVMDSLAVQYDLEQWLATARQPKDFIFGDWAVHTASWWAARDEPNVLVVTYGELKRNTIPIIQRVAEFLNVQLTPGQLDLVVEKSSFDWMRAHEFRFRPLMLPQRRNKARPLMMRRGQTGKSAELLSAEQQAAVDHYYRARLKQLDSDFPYDELFA